jgi:hypothetical protein
MVAFAHASWLVWVSSIWTAGAVAPWAGNVTEPLAGTWTVWVPEMFDWVT